MKKEFDETDNYLRVRQEEPDMFQKTSFRTIRIAPGVKAIIGILNGEQETIIQSVLFNKEQFDKESALRWLNKYESKMLRALEIENEKLELFTETIEDKYYEHLEGHLPPLSNDQIERLMELIGRPKDEEFQEEINIYGRLI